MTGGTVVVLGQTGKNFAAGMTGGVAYVLDENWDFYQRVNKETVSLEPVEHKYDVAALKELIREHVEATGSPRGKEILDNFSEYLPKFKKVLPYDYDRMLRVIASMEERAWTANRHRSKHSTLCRRRSKEGWIMGKITGFMDTRARPARMSRRWSALKISTSFTSGSPARSSRPRPPAAWTAAYPSARPA